MTNDKAVPESGFTWDTYRVPVRPCPVCGDENMGTEDVGIGVQVFCFRCDWSAYLRKPASVGMNADTCPAWQEAEVSRVVRCCMAVGHDGAHTDAATGGRFSTP